MTWVYSYKEMQETDLNPDTFARNQFKYMLYSVFNTFLSFVGCKGWEVNIENHRNGNNLWPGSENDRISHERKSSSRVNMEFFSKKKKIMSFFWYIYKSHYFIYVSTDLISSRIYIRVNTYIRIRNIIIIIWFKPLHVSNAVLTIAVIESFFTNTKSEYMYIDRFIWTFISQSI